MTGSTSTVAGERPQILHVMGWQSQQYGSFERFVVALSQRCSALGADTHLVFQEPVASARFLEDVDATVHVVPKARQVGDPLNSVRLGRVMRRVGATHLHAHFGYDSYNALAVARMLGIERRFTTKHIVPSKLRRELPGIRHRWLARQVEVIWPVSEWVAEHLERLGVPRSKIEVIYLGVDPDSYSPDPELRARMRAELGVDNATQLVLCASHPRPGKGTELLPSLAAALVQDPGGIVLLAAGDGILVDQLRSEAQALGLGDKFRLLGVREDVPALLTAADLFVFPTQANEGMPLGVLEAMAAGVPVAATAVSDIALMPTDAVSLVPQGDAEALTEACRRLLRDPDAAARQGAAGRRLMEERFSVASAVEAHVARYFAPRD
jgi:glycosyltransferase involved in cell wall biosynthesis